MRDIPANPGMIETALRLDIGNTGVLVFILAFSVLIIYFLIKFFSVFFEFIQANGCLTIGLIFLIGLPGIFALSLLSGYTAASAILILIAVIGLITGYIARNSEGGVGKFGFFMMIVSSITLVLAIILAGWQVS